MRFKFILKVILYTFYFRNSTVPAVDDFGAVRNGAESRFPRRTTTVPRRQELFDNANDISSTIISSEDSSFHHPAMKQSMFSPSARQSRLRDDDDLHAATIPMIQLDTIFRDSDLVADMDSVLNEIAIKNSMSTSPSNMTFTDDEEEAPRKPQGGRNLRELMNHQQVEKIPMCPSKSARKRLESTLDIEVRSRKSSRARVSSPDKENMDNNKVGGPEETTKKELQDERTATEKRKRGKKQETRLCPPVWVIEPDHNEDGLLRFKFTTDAGTCLVLKAEEALATIDIMKESSPSNTYFQVYSVDRSSSRVMLPEHIESCMMEIVAESKAANPDGNSTKPNNGIAQRLYFFVLRRRWRKVIEGQIRIASGASSNPSRFSSLTGPLSAFWDRMTKRDLRKTVDV